MRKESKPKDHSAVMVIRDHKCGADVKAARISIITDEGHLAGVTISRAALESQCSQDEDGGFRECVITLTDTRQVDCVVYSGYRRGGLSCDWDHVSGADKDPER